MHISRISQYVPIYVLLILLYLLLCPVQAAYIPPAANQTVTPTATTLAEVNRSLAAPAYLHTLAIATTTRTPVSGNSAADAATGANITSAETSSTRATDTLIVNRVTPSTAITTVAPTKIPTDMSVTPGITTIPTRIPKETTTPVSENTTPAATFSPAAGPTTGATANATTSGSSGKNLPLSWLIPNEFAPAASIVSGIALAGLAAALGPSLSGLWDMILAFLKNAIGGNLTGRYMEKEKEACREETSPVKRYRGFSRIELLVLAAGAIILGLLFLFADRKPFDPAFIVIYIVMGGIALILHELGHIVVERRYGVTTQVRFWGTGTIIMALTAWLFGNVFAQPYFTGTRNDESLDKKKAGLIMLAGPGVSVIVAVLCLALIPLGGIFATAGLVGFVMNLMTAVFEMLPIAPCEGKTVFSWKPVTWACFFIPVFIAYIVVTMQ